MSEREYTETEAWAFTDEEYAAILEREQEAAEAWARERAKARSRPTAAGTPPTASRTNTS